MGIGATFFVSDNGNGAFKCQGPIRITVYPATIASWESLSAGTKGTETELHISKKKTENAA
jgi:hypothetical protein